jgi:uncharacterized membrane protein YhhN
VTYTPVVEVLLVWLTGIFLLALLLLDAAGRGGLARGAKILASSSFLGLALAAGAWDSTYGRAILAALVLSWWGDLLLLSRRPASFRAGLMCFLLAHLAYVAAFLISGIDLPTSMLAAAVLAPLAALTTRWLLPRVPSSLKAPVGIYVVVITAMVAAAAGALGAGARLSLLGAAGAFYLSDLAVARERFVARSLWNRRWGLPLYYLAQVVFALSPRSTAL